MRVARSLTPREVVVEEVADPVAGPGEVVCRVLACGVCGSDVSETYVSRKLPGGARATRSSARCCRSGAGVRCVAVGDRVVIHHHVPCGSCRLCLRGHETLCAQFRCDRARSRRVRRAGAAVSAPLVGELLELGGAGPGRGHVRRAARAACCARSTARDWRPATRCSSSVPGSNGLLAVAAARARGVAAVWVREPRADRLRAGRGAGRGGARRRAGRRRVRDDGATRARSPARRRRWTSAAR